jgi:phosphoglycolate phosphatase
MTSETAEPTGTQALVLSGKVVSGTGRAAFFTGLEWVKSQCATKLGFEPYPGTLNLLLTEPAPCLPCKLPELPGLPLTPPDAAFCESRVYPVRIGDIPGALLLPEESVRMHGADRVEILAPVCLREKLQLKDGDRVCVDVITGTLITAQAVLFDLDGTLIDSTGVYLKMVEIALARLGLPEAPRDKVLLAAEKDPFDWLQIIPSALHHQHDALIPSAWRIIEEAYPALFREEVALIQGAADILNRLTARGIKIGIVTSTPRKHIRHKMGLFDTLGIRHLITAIIAAEDAPRKKPAPDPLIACAKLLGTPVSECIYIGDTRIDIRAGKAAGMKTIAVLTGFDPAKALAAEFPDAIMDSVSCLNRVLPLS